MKGSVGRLFIGLSALTLLGFDSNLIVGVDGLGVFAFQEALGDL